MMHMLIHGFIAAQQSEQIQVCALLDVTDSFTVRAGGPGPVPARCCRSVYFCKLAGIWDFLCVRCGCSTSKQRGPSSLPAAPVTGGLVLLLSSCRPPAEGRTLHKQTQAHRQWCIEVLEGEKTLCINAGWIMLTQNLLTNLHNLGKKSRWISGSYMDYLSFHLSHSLQSLT